MSLIVKRSTGEFPASAWLIKERLQEIDSRLGIVILPSDERGKPFWALTYWWHPDDPRRQWIREGNYDPASAFDILCFLPKDCTADEAYGYVVKGFKRLSGNAKEDARRLLERVHLYNHKQQQAALEETKEIADELLKVNDPARPRFFLNESLAKKADPKHDRRVLRDYLEDVRTRAD